MKKEDRLRKKELEKNLKNILAECPKTYKAQKIKKRDFLLWMRKDDIIIRVFPWVTVREEDLKAVMHLKIEYKPSWVDDLLWDILKMESNKNEPDSLRAIGAFTAVSNRYEDCVIELGGEDAETIRAKLYNEIDNMLENIEDLNEETYIDGVLNMKWVDDIEKALIYIHQGKIDEAKAMVMACDSSGRFGSEGKTFKELMIDYFEAM